MNTDLLITLQNYGFSEKEAKVYLTTLELGSSPASSIARRSEINRATVYTLLEELKKRGMAMETTKWDVKYYSVISPDSLLRQMEQKFEAFKEKMPELMALGDKFGNRPKVQFFEGLENLKKVYKDVILSNKEMEKNECFLSFLGTNEIDPGFLKFLSEEFTPRRLKYKTKTKAIISGIPQNNNYLNIHKKKHDSIFINKPIFDLSNEIIIYGADKIAILMYSTNEMSALVIKSLTLHKGLKSIFNLLWEINKAK